jgi:CheY-like chemotaxis protein
MLPASNLEILIVDDDAAVRNSLGFLLKASGYEVTMAANGFEALLCLKNRLPAILLSDLNMPEMSGFELLSVVRRRFPQVAVVAMSGAYQTGDAVPGGVIADAFYAKGEGNPADFLRTVANILQTSDTYAVSHGRQSAPVWIPRNGNNANGIPYVVVTCPDCFRSFPITVGAEDTQKIQETTCLFCPNIVRYIVDFSSSIASPLPGGKPPQAAGSDLPSRAGARA